MRMSISNSLAFLMTPALALFVPVSAHAQSFAGYQVQLNGSASIEDAGSTLRLTPALDGQRGSAYIGQAVVVDDTTSFSTFFQFRIHSGDGADGLTFVVHNDSDGSAALGGGGGSLGYGGIDNSLAVEVDEWFNGGPDPNGNHLGINSGGSLSSHTTFTPAADVDSGASYYVWVDYDAVTDDLEVYFNTTDTKPGAPDMTYNVDLESLTGDRAWVGFTAATGAANNAHDIEDWALDWSTGFVEAAPVPSLNLPGITALLVLVIAVAIFTARRRLGRPM